MTEPVPIGPLAAMALRRAGFRRLRIDGVTESPIEDAFVESAEKYLASTVTLQLQVPVATPHGAFRLDALATHPRHEPVAIELDGADWHHRVVDDLRDAAILQTGICQSVIRIAGKDILRAPDLVWRLLTMFHPWLGNHRTHRVLDEQMTAFGGTEPVRVSLEMDHGYAHWSVDPPSRTRPYDFLALENRTLRSHSIRAAVDALADWPDLQVRDVRAHVEAEREQAKMIEQADRDIIAWRHGGDPP